MPERGRDQGPEATGWKEGLTGETKPGFVPVKGGERSSTGEEDQSGYGVSGPVGKEPMPSQDQVGWEIVSTPTHFKKEEKLSGWEQGGETGGRFIPV